MNRKKKANLLMGAAIAIAVSLVLVLPGSAVITNTATENTEMSVYIEPIKEPIEMGFITDKLNEKTSPREISFAKTSMLLETDIPIIDNPELMMQNPTIACANNPDNICVMLEFSEDISSNNVGFINSIDGGESWADTLYYFEGDFDELPDIDYVGNIEGADVFRGTSVYEDGIINLYNIDDITDLEGTLSGSYVTWSDNGFYDFTSIDTACHNELIAEGDDYYIVACIASFSGLSGYEDQVQIPHYMVDTGGGGVSIFWFYYTDSSNAKIDIDKSSEIVYYAFQYKNETNQDVILLSSELEYVGEVEPEGWGDGMGEGRKRQIAGSANTINPAIAAENDYVYLIAQTDQGGNQDIICYHSSDGGDTYSMSIIADSSDDETYPEIYAEGEGAICVFTKGNNLYSAVTEDGGATWEIGEEINDVDGSVVDQLSNSDVYGDKCVWTDDRGSELSIYFDEVSGALPQPLITIEEISGGVGVSAVIKNIGDAPATDIDWSITLDGLVLLGGEASGKATLAPGETKIISSGFPLGFGPIDILVKADVAIETRSGTLILFFITGL